MPLDWRIENRCQRQRQLAVEASEVLYVILVLKLVHGFFELMKFLGIIAALQRRKVLIQNCWVGQSELHVNVVF